MFDRNVGPLIRILRLQHNWSLETLAQGICSVSYLSKIEQGKADVNTSLATDLFAKLGFTWRNDLKIKILRDNLYEGIFSWDNIYIKEQMKVLDSLWPDQLMGPYYMDLLVIRAYVLKDDNMIPNSFIPCLDSRQRSLWAILQGNHNEAYQINPCPLTAFCVAEEAYYSGNYIQALEYLQIANSQAAREGYIYLQMYTEHYMANCYSDMGNLEVMYRHSHIAARLGRVLGEDDLVRTIEYNIAATKLEFGNYEEAYQYFSGLEKRSFMDLHKLAISCEALGKIPEALSALDQAELMEAGPQEKAMLALVRYRLENPDYLHDQNYGELLLNVFADIKQAFHTGYARFHLRWVTQWLTANRQYRKAYELLCDFPEYHH